MGWSAPSAAAVSPCRKTLYPAAMSLADVERFARSSPAISGLLSDGAPQNLQAAVELAQQSGYGITVDDLRAFIASRGAPPGRRLSDDDLDKVTGGLGWSERL
jgi:hypothetical protein